MLNKWKRRILRGLSFTSVMFIFQACYGTMQDFGLDMLFEGQVKSKNTGLPIPGIKVSIANSPQFQTTNKEGYFSIYAEPMETMTFQFEDVDGDENGLFAYKDTTLSITEREIYLDVMLDEK